MNKEMNENWEKFSQICLSRLEVGEKLYGTNYERIDLYEEIVNELADVFNYTFLQFIKIEKLKSKKEHGQ